MSETHQREFHRAIPRVLCPHCGSHMRLSEVIPDKDDAGIMRFECACGFEYQM